MTLAAPPVAQVISWLRAVVVAHLIRQGYVVYQTGWEMGAKGVCRTCKPLMAQRPAMCAHGCHAPAADTDVAYVNKPIWESFLAFLEEAGADAAFQAEETGGELEWCCGRGLGAAFMCWQGG